MAGAMMPLTARYDGHADWYDSWNQPHAEHNGPQVRDLLGPGEGMCLDLGCGSGHYFDALAATGRTVVGQRCGSPPTSTTSRLSWRRPPGS